MVKDASPVNLSQNAELVSPEQKAIQLLKEAPKGSLLEKSQGYLEAAMLLLVQCERRSRKNGIDMKNTLDVFYDKHNRWYMLHLVILVADYKTGSA